MGESSSETNVPVGDWTTGTLKIYHDDKILSTERIAIAEFNRIDNDIKQLHTLLDERSVAQEKAVNAALTATQEAINKSETATEKRFDGVNEFRRTLSDQTSSFLPRTEFDAAHKALTEKVTAITDRINRSEGSQNGSELTVGKIYAGLAALGVVISLLVLLANGVFK